MIRLQRTYAWNRDNDEGQAAWDDYRKALILELRSWYGTFCPGLQRFRSTAPLEDFFFAGNTRLINIDAIIHCTGYTPSFPF
jgi:hypothetical protein